MSKGQQRAYSFWYMHPQLSCTHFAVATPPDRKRLVFVANVHLPLLSETGRVRNLNFARNLKFATSKTLVSFMKKMMFRLKIGIFQFQKALTYCTFNKSHLNSFILLLFPHVANFRYVANFRFLTLTILTDLYHSRVTDPDVLELKKKLFIYFFSIDENS